MVIFAVLGGLLAGGAIFALVKNSGNSRDDKYTKLKIG